jgi:3-isopropylmalate/(R)-2-methylmalate dehydratase small subunit
MFTRAATTKIVPTDDDCCFRKAGFNAVIAGSFAEIFFGNSTNLGVVCVVVGNDERKQIAELINGNPELVPSIV